MIDGNAISAVIIGRLAPHLGPHVAKIAMKSFSQKALGVLPEATTVADIPRLLEAMRPMLNVMLGRDTAEVVVADMTKALSALR